MRKYDDPAKKWCSQCKEWHNKEHGEFIVFNSGKNQRWMCNGCIHKKDLSRHK